MGYLRIRRSVRIGPGVKLNLNKRSVGLTVGGRGGHYSVNTRGQRTTTVGLPGTGISYIDRSTSRRRSRPAGGTTVLSAPPARPVSAPHPGLFARHFERAFYDGIQKLNKGDGPGALAAFVDADQSDDKHRALSPALLAGILNYQLGEPEQAIPYLERVTKAAQTLPDGLMVKYGGQLIIDLVVGHIPITLHVGSAAASMVLAECYRATGRLQEAIGLVQQLHEHEPDEHLLLLLCSMYQQAGDWDEIVHATAGITNQDDLTLLLRIVQADAIGKQGFPDAALDVYRDALKSKSRNPELLKEARYGRASLYLRTGKQGMAKRDLSRLYADNPDYKDVAQILRGLR
jgi:tetratricopeptide (TPR) repeat protein